SRPAAAGRVRLARAPAALYHLASRIPPDLSGLGQTMTSPSDGTFTFLLTDIEGSTTLVRRLRDQYGEVIAEHHRLLREAFEAAGGQGIGVQGDACFEIGRASCRERV